MSFAKQFAIWETSIYFEIYIYGVCYMNVQHENCKTANVRYIFNYFLTKMEFSKREGEFLITKPYFKMQVCIICKVTMKILNFLYTSGK